MSNVPEGNDSEFTWESFQQTVNKDLSDVLGNFVSRTTKFCNSKWGAVVPEGGEVFEAVRDEGISIMRGLSPRIKQYETYMRAMEFRKAIKELRELWVMGNEYLQRYEPWALYKTDPDKAAASIRFALNLIVLYANLARPFIPDTAEKIHKAMGTDKSWPKETAPHGANYTRYDVFDSLVAGHEFTIPENLFEKITDDQIAELSARFSGES